VHETATYIVVDFVKAGETIEYLTYNDIINNQNNEKLYVYLRQNENYYYFSDTENNIYQINKNEAEVLNYTVDLISGIQVRVPYEFGNLYKYIPAFNFFHPMSSY